MPRRGHNNRRRVEEEEEEDDDEEEEEDEEIENDEDDEDEDDDDEDDPLQHLPDYVLARVEKLQGLHAVRESIMDNYLIERAELEKKYESLLQPIYKERSTIIQGIQDDVDESVPNIATPPIENLAVTDNTVAEEEIVVEATANTTATAMDGEEGEEEEERLKGVPQFWACTMTRFETIGELVTVDDLGCLDYLIDITCTTHDDGKGFTLTFHFSPDNTYFTNPTLTKTYIVPNILISDEPIIKEVKGCAIFWKTGMSLTHKTVKKKQRGKGRNAGQVRSVTKQEEKESFFHWFTTPEMPTSMDDMDEEEAEHLEEVFENDFEIAQAFRNFIVPNAVQWFTGQASEGFMEQMIENAANEMTQ